MIFTSLTQPSADLWGVDLRSFSLRKRQRVNFLQTSDGLPKQLVFSVFYTFVGEKGSDRDRETEGGREREREEKRRDRKK